MRFHTIKNLNTVGLFTVKAGSQYDANAMLRYDIMLKRWNRLYFYSSVASVTSEQLTLALSHVPVCAMKLFL